MSFVGMGHPISSGAIDSIDYTILSEYMLSGNDSFLYSNIRTNEEILHKEYGENNVQMAVLCASMVEKCITG